MSLSHFAFTKLVVHDLESAATFYTSVFGLTERKRVSSEIGPRAIDEIMYDPTAPGAGSFILLRYRDATGPSNNEVIVGFVVDDVDNVMERAVGAGATVTREASDMPEHGVRVGFVTDPEGHLIEIVERLPTG